MEGFEVDAEEFKRHCANRGVTLNAISEAFAACKPKALSKDVIAQHAFVTPV